MRTPLLHSNIINKEITNTERPASIANIILPTQYCHKPKPMVSKDTELKEYYYQESQKDDRVVALKEEGKTATIERRQEISEEINKIELEYTRKYEEEIAKFKENLVRDFRKQMEEEARKVEEEGRRNAEQVLENAQKEAVATYNNSESRTGKKVKVYTSIERELEAQRKAAIEAEGEAHKNALAQITQVDPKQIEQETNEEIARIEAKREAKKKEAVDKFKANGTYKTDETLITEHITASKEGAEKQTEAQKKSLEQRKDMRKTLMDEYNLTEDMVATQGKVAKADAKRVKVKTKVAQSSATESNTPPIQEQSGGGKSGSGGGSYGGFINTNGLAQESTLRGIWELLNGGAPTGGWGDENDGKSGAPTGGWGDENDGKSGASSSVVDLNQFASGISDTVSIIKDLPHEAMGIVKSTGELAEVISGTKNSIADKDINAALARHVNETMLMALHNHPQGDKALSEDDLRGILGKSVKANGRANIRFGGSLADGTITTLDALQIPEKLHNTLISNYHKALVEELNNNPDVLAMKPSDGTFDGDIGIRSDILDNPELKAKAEEAMNRALVNALNKTVHNANAFKQFDVSGIQGFVDQVVKPAQEQVAKNVTRSGAKAAVKASKKTTKTNITQEEIDKYRSEHKIKFKTVQGENGKLKYADDKFSNRVDQALLNSNVLNKDDSTFVQEDAKRLQKAYDQIKQALAQDASEALGKDVIAFLQKLQGEIAQKLQANGYGLEKLDTSPSALIKDTLINKDNIDKAKTYLGSLTGDEYKGSSSVETGLKWVNSILSSTKQKLTHPDIEKLGNGYERLMQAVKSGLASKFDEDTKALIDEAIRISKQVLDQYNAEVIGSDSLLGKEITDANKDLVKNGAIGKIVTNITNPAIKIGGKLQQKATATMQKQNKKASATPQATEEGNVSTEHEKQEKLTRQTAENKERQAKATKEIAEVDKKVVDEERETFKQQKDAIASLFYTTGENGKKVWSKDDDAKALTFGLTNASKIFKDDLSDTDIANLHKTGLNLSKVLNLDKIDGQVLTDEMKAFIRDLIEKIKAKLNVDTFVEQEAKPKATQPKAVPTPKQEPKAPPAPKPTPTTTPTYSAGVPQPTGDGAVGGIPALVRALVQLPGVVAKDETVKQILTALSNGVKSTGSGGQRSGNGGQESKDIGYDAALEAMTQYVHSKYPGAKQTSKNVRANANSYSADFWRESADAQAKAKDIQKEIDQMRADGIEDEEKYISLLRQKEDLLQKQEKITVKINKEDVKDITSKVGIENYAVGANAAEKELSKFQGILSQLHEAGAIQFEQDGGLTSQNQFVVDWLKNMRDLQKIQDDLSAEGTLFASDNQPRLSQMTAQTSQLTKEVLGLLSAESKFGGNVVDTFANPQTLVQTGELYNKLLNIATASGKVDMATVKLSADGTTLTYTIEKGKNQVQDMTLHMNSLSGVVTQQAGEIRHVDTAWEKFGKSLKGKWQEVARYLATFGSIYRVWGMLKQGVGYIKEIDTALTELKKVTNETDVTYNKFLQDMAKTGSVVGATVKDLTSSAAD